MAKAHNTALKIGPPNCGGRLAWRYIQQEAIMIFYKITSVFITIFFLLSCATPIETANVSVKRGYKKSFSNNLGVKIGTLTEIIPANETPDNWTSMFTIQFMQGVLIPPDKAMKNLSEVAKSQCGNNFSSRIITQDKNSITFEWKVKECKQQDFMKHILRGASIEDCNLNYFTGIIWEGSKKIKSPSKCNKVVTQSEIVRFMKGNDGLHRVAFTQKAENITDPDRKKWLISLEKAYVIKGGKIVIVESN